MNCPKCKTEIPDRDIALYLASKGGSKTGPTKARDSAKMRAAALKRWKNRRKNPQPARQFEKVKKK